MNDHEFDKLISSSLKAFDADLPEKEAEEHVFSKQFEQKMETLLSQPPPAAKKSIRVWKWWFALVAVLLGLMACSLTAYGSKTNQIHFFADKFEEYQPLDTMSESIPAFAELTYDLDTLTAKYQTGVEILNGEQYTRFFTDPDTGAFFEFSSYPKLFFRYHSDTEHLQTEMITLGEKKITYFTDKSGIQYALWSASASVFVVRSDMDREQFLENVSAIHIYETN